MKKKPNLILQIEEPCSESWSTMTPVKGGKFCFQCEKRVINLSHLSDRELYHFYTSSNGNICAVMHQNQLNRPIDAPSSTESTLRQRIAIPALAACLSISSGLAAQTESIQIKENIEIQDASEMISSSQLTTVKGQVVDAKTGENLIGANVLVKWGNDKGTISFSEGEFELENVSANDVLIFSYIGYDNFEITVSEVNEIKKIKLDPVETLLEEVVVHGYKPFECSTVMGYVVSIKSVSEVDEAAPINNREVHGGIFPNPFQTDFHVAFDVSFDDKYLMNIYSIDGKLVYARVHDLIKGRQQIYVEDFPVSLPAGNYVLQVIRSNEVLFTRKLVKTGQ